MSSVQAGMQHGGGTGASSKRARKRSIVSALGFRNFLVIVMALSSIVSVIIFAVVALLESSSWVEQFASAGGMRAAETGAAAISAKLSSCARLLAEEALILSASGRSSAPALAPLHSAMMPVVSNVRYIAPNGSGYSATGDDYIPGIDIFASAARTPGVTVSKPYEYGGRAYITLGVAVRSGARVEGVLTADVDLDALTNFAAQTMLLGGRMPSAYCFIADRSGMIAGHPAPSEASGRASPLRLISDFPVPMRTTLSDALRGFDSTDEDYDGERRIFCTASDAEFGWRVVLALGHDAYSQSEDQLRASFMNIALTAVLISIVLSFIIGSMVAYYINRKLDLVFGVRKGAGLGKHQGGFQFERSEIELE